MQRSLFYQEASEIKHIFERCDKSSLIVIDEYARATSIVNGIALFTTLIESFTQRDLYSTIKSSHEDPPTVFISTNLKEVFTHKLIDPRQRNLNIVMIDQSYSSRVLERDSLIE